MGDKPNSDKEFGENGNSAWAEKKAIIFRVGGKTDEKNCKNGVIFWKGLL